MNQASVAAERSAQDHTSVPDRASRACRRSRGGVRTVGETVTSRTSTSGMLSEDRSVAVGEDPRTPRQQGGHDRDKGDRHSAVGHVKGGETAIIPVLFDFNEQVCDARERARYAEPHYG